LIQFDFKREIDYLTLIQLMHGLGLLV